MVTDEQIRAFVAIELPEEIKSHLTRLQEKLKGVQPLGVRWVRPEGIHLTLKFLGNVPSSLVPSIEVAIARGCEGVRPFSLKLAGLGFFPSKGRPRVIWIGAEGDIETLVDLQGRIDKELEKLGFARESRPFAPHLTLGRVEEAVPAEVRRKIGGLVDVVKVAPSPSFEARYVSLMRSKLMRGGAIYSRIAAIAL